MHNWVKRFRARGPSTPAGYRSLESLERRLTLSAASPVVASPPAAESAFALYASAVYSHVLQRAIDPAALAYWRMQLGNGLLIGQMATAVSHSPEYYADVVIGPDFQQYLHRAASASDIAFFSNALQSGTSDEQIEAALVASDEFNQRIGGTDADWIEAVYTSVLGRNADASGIAYWQAALSAGESRVQIALDFTESAEREITRVESDYSQVLGETPNEQSVAYWLSQLQQGALNENIVTTMAGSDDFFQRATGQAVTTVEQPSANSWFLPMNAQIDATAATTNPQVMFLGDSLTFGWIVFGNDAWNQYFSQFQPLDAGIPGDTTQNILWRLDHGLLDNIHPKLVVLMAGTNNIPFDSVADIAAGVDAIVAKLHQALPDTKVLVMGIPPTGASASYLFRPNESEANAILQTYANGVNTFYADITPDVLDAEGNQPTNVFFPDQVHLTDTGYRIYGQAIAPLVDLLAS